MNCKILFRLFPVSFPLLPAVNVWPISSIPYWYMLPLYFILTIWQFAYRLLRNSWLTVRNSVDINGIGVVHRHPEIFCLISSRPYQSPTFPLPIQKCRKYWCLRNRLWKSWCLCIMSIQVHYTFIHTIYSYTHICFKNLHKTSLLLAYIYSIICTWESIRMVQKYKEGIISSVPLHDSMTIPTVDKIFW